MTTTTKKDLHGTGGEWTCDTNGDDLWQLELTNPTPRDVEAKIYLDMKPSHEMTVPAEGKATWVYRVIDGTPDLTAVDVVVDGKVVHGIEAEDTCSADIAPVAHTEGRLQPVAAVVAHDGHEHQDTGTGMAIVASFSLLVCLIVAALTITHIRRGRK